MKSLIIGLIAILFFATILIGVRCIAYGYERVTKYPADIVVYGKTYHNCSNEFWNSDCFICNEGRFCK